MTRSVSLPLAGSRPHRDGARVKDPIPAAAHVAAAMLPHVASAVSMRFGFHLISAAQRRSSTNTPQLHSGSRPGAHP